MTHGAQPITPWTAEKVDLIRRMWAEGATCKQIAERLGEGITRNAVIGKARRLGLAMRTRAGERPEKKKREKRETPPHDGSRPADLPPVPTMPGKPSVTHAARHNQIVKVSALTGRPVRYEKPAPIRPEVVEKPEGTVLVQHLKVGHCRYPIAEAGAPGRWCFCPEPAVEGHSWCEHHYQVCYWPQAQARRRA